MPLALGRDRLLKVRIPILKPCAAASSTQMRMNSRSPCTEIVPHFCALSYAKNGRVPGVSNATQKLLRHLVLVAVAKAAHIRNVLTFCQDVLGSDNSYSLLTNSVGRMRLPGHRHLF